MKIYQLYFGGELQEGVLHQARTREDETSEQKY